MTLRGLSTAQYDMAVVQADNRLRKRINGRVLKKPERKDFGREWGSVFNWMDLFLALIFVSAFIISSIHIIQTTGRIVHDSPVHEYSGIYISKDDSAIAHQIFSILMADAAMIFFFVMFALQVKKIKSRKDFGNITMGVMSLAAALFAASFVLYSNVESGLGLLGVLPPFFTITGGFRIENIITELIYRKNEIDRLYLEAMLAYEENERITNEALKDITTHPEYRTVLMQAVWDRVVSYNKIDPAAYSTEDQAKLAIIEINKRDWSRYADMEVEEELIEEEKPKHDEWDGSKSNKVREWIANNPQHHPKKNSQVTYPAALEEFIKDTGIVMSNSTFFKALQSQNGSEYNE
jgi:hypothetical protein